MVKMKYTFKDGSTIDLLNVYEVTEIKDYGDDNTTIDQSTLCFTIRFKSGNSKKISMNYHYNDWFEVYKELKAIRIELIKNWEAVKKK
jgi:hypothetical protein